MGVSWHKVKKTWSEAISVRGKITFLGQFTDEVEAARAYDAGVITNNLDRAVNFPEAGGHRPQAKKAKPRLPRSSVATIPNPGASRFAAAGDDACGPPNLRPAEVESQPPPRMAFIPYFATL